MGKCQFNWPIVPQVCLWNEIDAAKLVSSRALLTIRVQLQEMRKCVCLWVRKDTDVCRVGLNTSYPASRAHGGGFRHVVKKIASQPALVAS